MARDYYDVLGVGRNATEQEIKRAFRRLAREHHPDANPGDAGAEDRFKEIAEAYEVLSDPEMRRRYDAFGHAGVGRTAAGPMGFEDVGFGDVFDAFFGGDLFGRGRRRRSRSEQRGSDIVVEAELSFEQAVFGTTIDLPPIETMVACGDCHATGSAAGGGPSPCPRCQGSGEIRDVRRTFLGNVITAYPCSQCGGTGQEIADPCPACHGEGRVQAEVEIPVDVPAGIEKGSQLRLAGRGHAGRRGGPAGDLYVSLRIRPHPLLERSGTDLIYNAKISIAQAALGTVLKIPTLDGDKELPVEPGTQSGTVRALKGLGVPRIKGRGRGDLLVNVEVVVPDDLSADEAELLRKFAELRGESVLGTEARARRKGAFRS